jgi:hypothetical protein
MCCISCLMNCFGTVHVWFYCLCLVAFNWVSRVFNAWTATETAMKSGECAPPGDFPSTIPKRIALRIQFDLYQSEHRVCQFARAAHAEENQLDTPMTLSSGTAVCEISALFDSGAYKSVRDLVLNVFWRFRCLRNKRTF